MYWNSIKQAIEPLVNKLNSNIRCIEIMLLDKDYTPFTSWIVTLDVLK